MPPWRPGDDGSDSIYAEFMNEVRTTDWWFCLASWVTQPLLCRVVKVVMTGDNTIYFMNTNTTAYHYDFLKARGLESRPLAQFNDEVYSGQKRDIICATLVKYGELEDTRDMYPWTFEMVATDPLVPETCERVALALQKIQAAFSLGTLHVRATSHQQVTNLANPAHPLAKFPRCDSTVIWGGKTYGCIMEGSATAVVRYIKDASNLDEIESLNLRDLVYFERGIPNDLPSVAGVVFAEPLPPLCHIALLCRSRGTPCCFDTKESTRKQFEELANKDVVFYSGPKQNYAIVSISAYAIGAKYNPGDIKPIAEPSVLQTMPLRFSDTARVPPVSEIGAKARQCAMTNVLLKQTELQTKSFAIPMGAYIRHVAPVKAEIKTICQRHGALTAKSFPSIKDVKKELENIRNRIHETPIDKELLKANMDLIKGNGMDHVILRSSTNAEDIEGFSGAGLYTSVPLQVSDIDDQKLENAIKTVWASVWLPSAYLERLRFRIQSDKVAMCILVQPYYNSESLAANGVAVTENPFRPEKYGTFVTTFVGGAKRATDGVTDVQPEQTMVHMSRVPGRFEVELVSPLRGPGIDSTRPACDPEVLKQLGEYCAQLHKQIHHQTIEESCRYLNHKAIDVEWLLLKQNNKVLIIQARPCTIAKVDDR